MATRPELRIACVQFSPQRGDLDNNLERADQVIRSKAKPEQLENLNLLILPEFAFSGLSIRDRDDMERYLEPHHAGKSFLWASAKAMMYKSNVIVGYVEGLPGKQCNSAAIMVDAQGRQLEGKTISDYCRVYQIEGMGKVCVVLGMDNLVKTDPQISPDVWIVCMAWFASLPETPKKPHHRDRETIDEWELGLYPFLKAQPQREVIVVLCNRSGPAHDVSYTGTSSILSFKNGEVHEYAVAGRGTREFLFASIPASQKRIPHEDNPKDASPSTTAATSKTTAATNAITRSRTEPTTMAKRGARIPKLQISGNPVQSTEGGKESLIPTPTGPSPTPMAMRPYIPVQEDPADDSPDRFWKPPQTLDSPFPGEQGPWPRTLGQPDTQPSYQSAPQVDAPASGTRAESIHQDSPQRPLPRNTTRRVGHTRSRSANDVLTPRHRRSSQSSQPCANTPVRVSRTETREAEPPTQPVGAGNTENEFVGVEVRFNGCRVHKPITVPSIEHGRLIVGLPPRTHTHHPRRQHLVDGSGTDSDLHLSADQTSHNTNCQG